ncbi:MAG: hypothetical protein F4060_10255 [Holophagales bacterium]|nr:hypothetical protein [Holophagales bacterium]MXX63361.1 hypothetical protein [Holophagales bacterium]MYA08141.1 hypothetical protein [Holophagales bacterium]MYC10702.1 hypothetical protein [Holophagales bacterium]MYD23369.1 hypothetical protein [Holophagales bacterium]
MTEPETQQPSSSEPPAPPEPPGSDGASSNRNLMVVLAYLWVLVLVPLLIEERDEEVRWHAKHGLVLMGAEFMLWVVLQIALFATGGIGCFLAPFIFMLFVAFVLVRIACIVRGINGGRLQIPVLTPLVERF